MSHKKIDAIGIGGPTKVVHQATRCGKAKCRKMFWNNYMLWGEQIENKFSRYQPNSRSIYYRHVCFGQAFPRPS